MGGFDDVSALLERARAGDEEAFAELLDPYRHELHIHCYRILGSSQDAEDMVQETLLVAWRSLGRFEGRSSLRTWLYRIATNRCLDALRANSRRPPVKRPKTEELPGPTRMNEVVWLEPLPDRYIEEMIDTAAGPESRYETREAISLAFISALQHLPPAQRVVLVLRDVLGFRASEVADILDTTEDSVESALKRARRTARSLEPEDRPRAPEPNSRDERLLLNALTTAFVEGDLDALVSLLGDDVRLSMPPAPFVYEGKHVAAQALSLLFAERQAIRLIETRANGQPAFGLYVGDSHTEVSHAAGLAVLTLSGSQIAAMTMFDNSVLARFGLPRTLQS